MPGWADATMKASAGWAKAIDTNITRRNEVGGRIIVLKNIMEESIEEGSLVRVDKSVYYFERNGTTSSLQAAEHDLADEVEVNNPSIICDAWCNTWLAVWAQVAAGSFSGLRYAGKPMWRPHADDGCPRATMMTWHAFARAAADEASSRHHLTQQASWVIFPFIILTSIVLFLECVSWPAR